MNIIIVTGASSGLGKEFIKQIDSLFTNIDEIWLIARRKEPMEELASEIKLKSKIFSMDVTDAVFMEQFSEVLQIANPKIRMLVNCAGFGLMGAVEKLPIEEQLAMIRLNCEALTEMTYRCLPYMKKNSRIIQLASSAAFLPQENFSVYSATKAYVHSFSRSLSRELRKQKIYVTSVCPGPVNTEFFDIAEKYGKTLTLKKMTLVDAEGVVRQALRDSYRKKQVSVYSPPIRLFRFVCKVLPHGFILKIASLLK